MIHQFEASDHLEKSHNPLITTLLCRVFVWMSSALIMSALAAYYAFDVAFFQKNSTTLILFIAQITLVFFLMRSIRTLSYSFAQLAFLSYAILMGFTLSSLFRIYTTASLAQAFIISSCMFFVMALYGFITKRDLSSYKSLLSMGLSGLIIILFVQLLFPLTRLNLFISAIGTLLFSALIAYDMQYIKQLGDDLLNNQEPFDKVALICALTLYLDFINLFLNMLNVLSNRKNT